MLIINDKKEKVKRREKTTTLDRNLNMEKRKSHDYIKWEQISVKCTASGFSCMMQCHHNDYLWLLFLMSHKGDGTNEEKNIVYLTY